MIIKQYAPIALDDDLCERIARGEPVSEKSVNHAMRAALIMLAAMDFGREAGKRKLSKSETLTVRLLLVGGFLFPALLG